MRIHPTLAVAMSVSLFSAAAQAQPAAITADPRNFAQLSGSWSYAPFPGGSDATFIDASGRAQLVLRCDRASRRIVVGRPATAAAPTITLWSTEGARAYPAVFDASTGQLRAAVAANDPMLDALVFSRGSFGIGVSGLAPVAVPAWPEATRAIEDCRN